MLDVPGPWQCWKNLSLLSFASRWIYAWRALDVETILSMVSPDVEFYVGIASGSHPLQGKPELASALVAPNFVWDLKIAPNLTGLITGEDVLVIDYRDDAGVSFTETLMFRGGRVCWRQMESDPLEA
ncbi:hypothetical protein C6401_13955 [Arthrobacter woluwensis]|uniref:hypothetical protein n=1 Tax=Arthrobacter woluwensis TaxID=156980 RepID=UPI000D127227|nr:hypothetical protein [Arthrobacter woluwensis]PSS43144.1 hypothetical protein C6401_13955 [Arthrobacter woluwensis]